jgi:hypothetical protein
MDAPDQAAQPAILSNGTLPGREAFPRWLNELNLAGGGAEIGVQRGDYSEFILRHWKGKVLFSIDPWTAQPASEYPDIANVSQADQTELYRVTILRLHAFGGRSKIVRLTSEEAAPLFEPNTLDFCYIDADHRYEAVKRDLELWYGKVRSGGILGGHDYIPDGSYDVGLFGVQGAVDEFVKAHELQLILSTEENNFPSWFVLKP